MTCYLESRRHIKAAALCTVSESGRTEYVLGIYPDVLRQVYEVAPSWRIFRPLLVIQSQLENDDYVPCAPT